jgi:UPF0716 protein FxsA
MNPLPILLLLFFTVPLIEIFILIEVGGWIGAIPTIFLVVFTAVLGALLLRHQGLITLQRFQLSLAQGQVPAMELIEGVVLIIAGALLLTPGFFTDLVGFLCLIPPLRQAVIRRIVERRLVVPESPRAKHPHKRGRVTIEGEFKREDE